VSPASVVTHLTQHVSEVAVVHDSKAILKCTRPQAEGVRLHALNDRRRVRGKRCMARRRAKGALRTHYVVQAPLRGELATAHNKHRGNTDTHATHTLDNGTTSDV